MRPPTLQPGCRARALRQHGAASLIVVMLLFFLLALVAAYTSRNLVFEQRTAVNQYRSTQAFEAAEAGLEWALAMLNGGRIGADCLPADAAAGETSFRQRYLDIDPSNGRVTPATRPPNPAPLRAGCVWGGATWTCSCPADGAPTLSDPAGPGIHPAFRIRFSDQGISQPGLVRIEALGCLRLDDRCLEAVDFTDDIEGRAQVSMLVALKGAIATPPAAALSVSGSVSARSALSASNTDPAGSGLTILAGGSVGGPTGELGGYSLRSLPGTPPSQSVVAADPTLATLSTTVPGNRVFASVFGAWPDSFRLQPAATSLACPARGCSAALSRLVAAHPDGVIWVDGDLTLEAAGDIGSPPDPANTRAPGPVALVVTGHVDFLVPGVRLYGLVYSGDGSWSGRGEIHGAAFVEGDLAATAAPTVVLNGAVLDALRLRTGSFVRLPGGWKDYP